jgi:hypothetical protein
MLTAPKKYTISSRDEYDAKRPIAELKADIESTRNHAFGPTDPRLQRAAQSERILLRRLARERKAVRRASVPKAPTRRLVRTVTRRAAGRRGLHVSRSTASRSEGSGSEPPSRSSDDPAPPLAPLRSDSLSAVSLLSHRLGNSFFSFRSEVHA